MAENRVIEKELSERGLKIRLNGEKLQVESSQLSDSDKVFIKSNRDAIFALLSAPAESRDYAAQLRDSMEQSGHTQHEVYVPLQHPPQKPLQPRTAVIEPHPPMRAPNSLKREAAAPRDAYVITPRTIIEALDKVNIMRINEVYDLLKQAPLQYWANISEYKATYARNWDYTALISDRQRLAEDAAILWLRQRIADLIEA